MQMDAILDNFMCCQPSQQTAVMGPQQDASEVPAPKTAQTVVDSALGKCGASLGQVTRV